MTHGCTDCGYDYMGMCEVYADGSCRRDRDEARTEELSDEQIYELQSSERDYCKMYEPTYNLEDGSM